MCIKNQLMNGKISDLQYELDITKQKLKEKDKECEQLKKQVNKLEKQLQESQTNFFQNNGREVHSKSKLGHHKSLVEENKLLQEEVSKLKSIIKKHGINVAENDNADDIITLAIPCGEASLFENEISDFLYKLLYGALEKERKHFPANRKDENYWKLDVLNALLDAKVFLSEKSATAKMISGLDSVLNRKTDLSALESFGFKKADNNGSHPKYYFYDKRYPIIFSLTPRWWQRTKTTNAGN